MGLLSNKRESHLNVLKLVHPGGFVELHTKPLMASQIMNKYPRHCITRPDIFRFPWIVVSPEAILKPGKVFFIVPYRTIRHLLKKSSSIATNHSSMHLHQCDRKVSSFIDQDRHMRHDENSKGRPCDIKLPLCTGSREGSESLCKSSIKDTSLLYIESREGSEPLCKSFIRDTNLNSYLQKVDSTTRTCDPPHMWQQLEPLHRGFPSQNKNSSSKKIQCSKKEDPKVPCMKLRKGGSKGQGFARERHVYYSSEYYYASHDVGKESHSEQVTKLKSCLKKDNTKSHNVRTPNLKVRFACNEDKFNKTL